MGRTFSFSLNFSGHRIRDISLTWGLRPISDVREAAPTYGTDIEVPAVIELLDLIISGAVSAQEARGALSEVATQVNEEQDRDYEQMLELAEIAYAKTPQITRPARIDSRWVYVVSSEDNPKVVKIGVARNVGNRIRNLQVGAPTRIVLRWSARGGLPLESYLHEKFSRRRMSGEWFDFRRVSDPVKMIEQAAQGFQAAGDSAD